MLGPLVADDVFDPVDGAIQRPRYVVTQQLGYSSDLLFVTEIPEINKIKLKQLNKITLK